MEPGLYSDARGLWSFAGGAGMLPAEVLAELGPALASRRAKGRLSALELPFGTAAFRDLQDEAEADLRALLGLPPRYHVLFLQGGATAHFWFVPMNLAGLSGHAAYLETGLWSRRAIAAARAVAEIRIATEPAGLADARGAAYCHLTPNETADGACLPALPALDPAVPIVADMTADLLTAPIEVERFGLIYASAQKNLGTAGLTLVIVRDDLLGQALPGTPAPFNYALQAREHSRVNTPPVAAIRVAASLFKWLRRQGGLAAMERRRARRSATLYTLIDSSGIYSCPIKAAWRSPVNVCFRLPSPELEAQFLDAAERRGLLHLKGHPAVGGIRISLYNGVPDAAVEALADFMAEFARPRAGGASP